jgi:hypothetical protein
LAGRDRDRGLDRISGGKKVKDKNGRVLEIGDPVLIRGRVTHLSEAVGRNATVETAEVLPGAEDGAKTNLSLSSTQVEYDESAGAVDVVANDDPAANPNPPAAADATESQDNEAADDEADEHAEGDGDGDEHAEGKKGKSKKAAHGKRH